MRTGGVVTGKRKTTNEREHLGEKNSTEGVIWEEGGEGGSIKKKNKPGI